MTNLYNNPCVTTLLKPANLALIRGIKAIDNASLLHAVVRDILKDVEGIPELKEDYINELIYHITEEVSQVLTPAFVFGINTHLVETIENLKPHEITERLITGTVIMHLNQKLSMFEFNLYVILSSILNLHEEARAILRKRLADAGLAVFQEVADENVLYFRQLQDLAPHIQKYKYDDTFVNKNFIEEAVPVKSLDPTVNAKEAEYVALLKMRGMIFSNKTISPLLMSEAPYTQNILVEIDSGFISLVFFKSGYIMLNDVDELLADEGMIFSLNEENLPETREGIERFIELSITPEEE